MTDGPEVLAWVRVTEEPSERVLRLPGSETRSDSAELFATDRPEVLVLVPAVVNTSDGEVYVEARLPTRDNASVTGNLEDTRLVVLREETL